MQSRGVEQVIFSCCVSPYLLDLMVTGSLFLSCMNIEGVLVENSQLNCGNLMHCSDVNHLLNA